jgi:predicted transcriptional regulator
MEKKIIRVKDIMRTHFGRIDRRETVRTALSMMQDSNARALIVNKRDENDELGIVVLADIAKLVLARDKSPDRVNVYEIMSKPVIQVTPNMDIRYCARLFDRFGLERAPVVENGEILGIVSYHVLVLRGLMQFL